jgi:hypothetical protein
MNDENFVSLATFARFTVWACSSATLMSLTVLLSSLSIQWHFERMNGVVVLFLQEKTSIS